MGMAEWKLTQDDFINEASLGQTSVFMDKSSESNGFLEVMAEAGSGYMQQNITTRIPMKVLLDMLAHAGYRVDY